MKNVKIISLFSCLAVLLLFGSVLHAEHDPLKGLSGPPFTDPNKIQKMPAVWEKQPVNYEPSAGKADIVLTLDQHMYPALLPVIQKYAKEQNLKIVVTEGTCGITGGMLERKAVDIGGFCCPPGVADRLPGLKFHTIGIDALALIVHPDNTVDNITLEEARQIFSGEKYRWSELKTSRGEKGLNLPIQPIARLHCKLRPGHWRLLLDNENLFSPLLQEVGTIPDMISQVASNPRAIGYVVLWNPVRYKDKGKIKSLRINGYSPYEKKHLISGRYKFYRVYNLTTWEVKGAANPEAQKLVKYLLGQGRNFDKEHNIIPVSRLRQAGWKFRGNELVGEPE